MTDSHYIGSPTPRMMLVGEAWGAEEAAVREPFVGVSGQELWRILGEAMPQVHPELHAYAAEMCRPHFGNAWIKRRAEWLEAAGIGFTNVLNLRPPNNDLETICVNKAATGSYYPHGPLTKGKYLDPQYLPEVDRLHSEITQYNPNLVVALGNTACWAILNTSGITAIRGTTSISHRGSKVLPTFHPAGILREWSNRVILISDLIKAERESHFPEIRRPERHIIINPTLDEVYDWVATTIPLQQPLSVDIETSMGLIDTIGFSRSASEALVIPFGPFRYKVGTRYEVIFPVRDGQPVKSYWTSEEEPQVWRLIRRLLESPLPKVFQNGLYDLQYILPMGIRPANCIEDTMLAWHALFPELRKSLGFLGSILTDETAWKTMNRYRADTTKRDE